MAVSAEELQNEHEFGPRNNLPPYVCIPTQPNVYAGTGYLSSSYAGFSLGSDPADAGFTVRDLNLPGNVDEPRFVTRRRLLDVVNGHFHARVYESRLQHGQLSRRRTRQRWFPTFAFRF